MDRFKRYLLLTGVTIIMMVISVLASMLILDSVFSFIFKVRVDVATLVTSAVCVGVVLTVWFGFVSALLLSALDEDFVGTLAPMLSFQRQIDGLNLKIPECQASLDELAKVRREAEACVQAMDKVNVLSCAINQRCSELSDREIDVLRRTISKQLEGCALEFTNKGFTLIWNSLPYHQHFDKFDDDDKVAYFNAIRTGNWQPLRRRSKDKWVG